MELSYDKKIRGFLWKMAVMVLLCLFLSACGSNSSSSDETDSPSGESKWYKDMDGDGYSDGTEIDSEERPAAYYYLSEELDGQSDCDDDDPTTYPGAAESCDDSKDNNCNGQTNENCETASLSTDDDGDGISENQGDCDDENPAIYPGAPEICKDGIDNDCDGEEDENCPIAPASVTATPGEREITIDWQPVEGATAYMVYKAIPVTGTTYVDRNLNDSESYHYKVSALTSTGETPLSETVSAIPLASAAGPDTPTGVTATAGVGRVTITWQPASGAASYRVYYGDTLNFSKVNSTEFYARNTSYTHMTTGTSTHYYKVSAVNSDGESPLSEEVHATPEVEAIIPSRPTNVAVEEGDSQATLYWNFVQNASTYNIYGGESRGVSISNSTITRSNVRSPYEVTGLENGTTYYFIVTAENAVDESLPSAEVSVTPVAPAQDFTNSLGMEFIYVPAETTFEMGCLEGEPQEAFDEVPRHTVRFAQGFHIMTTEVTQAHWQSVMGNSPSAYFACGGNCPVENVSWNDVQLFIQALNNRNEGPKGTYRLPTEAEWECAARAGTTTPFYNGQIVNRGCADYHLDEIGWYCGNGNSMSHPVGQKIANAWGLYDMLGNVMEWVEDDWHAGYHGAPNNGSAWINHPRGKDRICRGGNFASHAAHARAAFRGGMSPGSRYSNIGFRLAFTQE